MEELWLAVEPGQGSMVSTPGAVPTLLSEQTLAVWVNDIGR